MNRPVGDRDVLYPLDKVQYDPAPAGQVAVVTDLPIVI